MPADTPTLNRAANQIVTVGIARLTRDEVAEIAGNLPVGNVAKMLGILLSRDVGYWGVDANNCFTFREGAPPRMSGRKEKGPYSTVYWDDLPKPTHPWRVRKKRDDGDGAPA